MGYTSPQSLNRWFNNHGDFYLMLIVWFIKLSVQTFQPLIVIYRRDDFVYHHRNVHKFIGLCLIPLDPWIHPPTQLPDFLLTNVFSSFAFFEISCKKQFLIKRSLSSISEGMGKAILIIK